MTSKLERNKATMGLTDCQQELIAAVAHNNIQRAKQCAIACITEDETKKNEWFCKKYKQILTSSGNNLIEISNDLKGILCVEDVSTSFNENRYYLTQREKEVFDHIIRMKAVNEKLAEMGIPYKNSTLLYGESGTGKTTFGWYVAYKTGLPFCYLNFSNVVDSYMGKTSKNIEKAFSYVISNPCVFMLDEIDCISIRRANAGDGASGEMARVTISLMQEFDKLTNDIIVIGATNRKDRIDEALLRRFSAKHEVKEFTREEKEQMVEKYLRDVNMDFTREKINELIESSSNQSVLINALIQEIARKVYEDVTERAEN